MAGLGNGLLGNAKNPTTGTAITFGLFEDFLVTGACCYASFYSWHQTLLAIVGQHAFYQHDIRVVHHRRTTQVTFSLGAFLGEYVAQMGTLALVATGTGTLEAFSGPANALLLIGHCFLL